MAFVTTNELKINELADKGDPVAQKILKLKNRPQSFLTSILIGNNIVNVAATAIVTYGFQHYFEIESEWLVTAVMMPLLLVFGELAPKDYCRQHGQEIILGWANPLSLFTNLLKIPSDLILRSVNAFVHLLGIKKDKSIFVSETEFRMVIEESEKTGVLESFERQIINRILDFERIKVESVMVPIDSVAKVNIDSTVKEVKSIAKKNNAKIILVYEEIPTLIVGVIYVFDLLFEEKEKQGLKNYLRSPTFLTKETSLEKAFLTLQQRRQSFAVVTDQKNEVQGIVRIEKLVTV